LASSHEVKEGPLFFCHINGEELASIMPPSTVRVVLLVRAHPVADRLTISKSKKILRKFISMITPPINVENIPLFA
jgi:hypothetical protein